MITQKHLDDLTYEVIGSAIEVHKALGRGLLESVYHECMKEELARGQFTLVGRSGEQPQQSDFF